MSGPTMAQRMRRDSFAQPGLTSRLLAGDPHHLIGDGLFGPAAGIAAGKQVGLRLAPAPVFAQCFEQRGAEWNIAAAAPLPRSTRIIICWLSMSRTFKRASSARLIPVP